MRRLASVLVVVALVLVAAGSAVRVVGLRPAVPELAPPTVTAPEPVPDRAATLLGYHAIVRTDPFSPARTAPARRFSPAAPEAAPTRPAAPATSPQPPLRVYGTAVAAGDAVALIDADPRVPGAEIYRIGDRLGPERLVDIGPGSVTVQGPAGRRVLRIESQRKGPES